MDCDLKESLIQTLDHHLSDLKQSYEVELVDSAINVLILEMFFDNRKRSLIFRIADIVWNCLNFDDIIGAFENQTSDILPKNFDFKERKFIKLNYFPKITITQCSLCGICCCNCKKRISRRMIKVRLSIEIDTRIYGSRKIFSRNIKCLKFTCI